MRRTDQAVAVMEPIQAEEVPFVIPVIEKPEPLGFFGLIAVVFNGIMSAWEWCFGFTSLLIFLSVLAAIPLFQFLTLGYLLEASARIARTGRIRDGFIGVRIAARAGGFIVGTWLMLLPLRLVSSFWLSAQIIEADGSIARGWDIGLTVLTVLMMIHIALAWAAGGKLRHFLFPFANPILVALKIARGGFWAKSRDAVWEFAASLRLPYYFWLGVRGFIGGLLWIGWPVTLLAFGRKVPVLGFLGALLLMMVMLYVPFLQLRFAVENRFMAFFELGAVRQLFRRAPIALAFAFFITLLFAIPLYLLKIEMIPREAAWLPSLVFILFMFPARILTGWAYGRGMRRETPRNFVFRWTSRFFMLLVTFIYVVIVYFSQFAAWEGIFSLYEQHAFMLPVPFLAM